MKKLILILSLVGLIACEQEFEDTTPEPNADKKVVEFISFNSEQNFEVGEQAPNFAMNPNSDQEKDLRDFRGKLVMLEFSAEWCSICKAVAPKVAEASRNIDTSKFAIIKVFDAYYEKEKFLTDANLYEGPFYRVWNGTLDGFDMMDLYDIRSVPRSVFIDESGVVIETRGTAGIENIAEYMQELANQ